MLKMAFSASLLTTLFFAFAEPARATGTDIDRRWVGFTRQLLNGNPEIAAKLAKLSHETPHTFRAKEALYSELVKAVAARGADFDWIITDARRIRRGVQRLGASYPDADLYDHARHILALEGTWEGLLDNSADWGGSKIPKLDTSGGGHARFVRAADKLASNMTRTHWENIRTAGDPTELQNIAWKAQSALADFLDRAETMRVSDRARATSTQETAQRVLRLFNRVLGKVLTATMTKAEYQQLTGELEHEVEGLTKQLP